MGGGSQVKSKLRICLFVTGILIPAILMPVLTGCGKPVESSPAQPNPEQTQDPAIQSQRVDVVYFHRTQQCYSCKYAEEHLQTTLEKYYADELVTGRITFQSLNVQDRKNAAIVKKYAAYSSQLFITTVKGDEEVTEEVKDFWNYIDNDAGFSKLIIKKIKQALASIE